MTHRAIKADLVATLIEQRFEEIAISSDKKTLFEFGYLKRKVNRIHGSYGWLSRFIWDKSYIKLSNFNFMLKNLELKTIPNSNKPLEKISFFKDLLKYCPSTEYLDGEYLLGELTEYSHPKTMKKLSDLYNFVTAKNINDDFVQLDVDDYTLITTEIKSE